MSHIGNDALRDNLFDQYLDELYAKYFVALDALGDAKFSKTDKEIEDEAQQQVEDFMTRNG